MTGLAQQVNQLTGVVQDLVRPNPKTVGGAYHLWVGRQSFAFGGGAKVAVGWGLAMDYLNTVVGCPKRKTPLKIADKLPDFSPAYQTTCTNHALRGIALAPAPEPALFCWWAVTIGPVPFFPPPRSEFVLAHMTQFACKLGVFCLPG